MNLCQGKKSNKGVTVKYVLVLLCLASVACSRIGTGELGLVLDFNRQIKPEAVVNSWEFHILDTLYVVDSSQIRVPIKDIRAKDIDGILFQDIDAQVTYNLNPKGATRFYELTKEVDYTDKNEYTLGLKVVAKEARNVLIKTFTEFKASQVNTEKTLLETTMLKLLTEELNKRYPDTFVITDVNIDSAQLDPNVEKVLQAQALIDSEKRTIQSRMELQKKQSELLDMELMEIRATASKIGISVSDMLRYKNEKERNRVLSEMARNNQNTQIQIKD